MLVIMGQFTRRIIGFGVHQGDVDSVALCCLFNQAISSKSNTDGRVILDFARHRCFSSANGLPFPIHRQRL